MELLNSKRDHHDYMCDHTAWGVRVVTEVNSPNVKLLYDIYHMQIMEGDLIATIRQNIQWIGHFHTGGVPGRHELDGTQEVQWDGVMRGIADAGFKGYVAHEFVPAARIRWSRCGRRWSCATCSAAVPAAVQRASSPAGCAGGTPTRQPARAGATRLWKEFASEHGSGPSL